MKQKNKTNILYFLSPYLLAVSFLLTLYFHNIGELTLKILISPLTAIIIAVSALITVASLVLKDKHKSIALSAVYVILFFSYGDVSGLTEGKTINLFIKSIDKNWIYLSAYLVSACLTVYFLKINKKKLYDLLKFLLIVSAIGVIMPFYQIVNYEINKRPKKNVTSLLKLPSADLSKLDINNLPDIYYIVPDSYSAAANFKKYFGYDNSRFTDELLSRGFYVASDSASNYPKTYLSLSSTLNMEYLDYLSVFTNSDNELIVSPLIHDNNVLKFLLSVGYKYYQSGAWWGPTQQNRLADKNYTLDLQNSLGLNGFNYYVLESTVLKPVIDNFSLKSIVTESVEDKRRRTEYQFDVLPEIARLPGPKFVFSHILAPHGPNVFGPNCEHITQESLKGKTDEEGYNEQVQCINKKILEAVDGILKNSAKPPVILIQSDEGAPFLAHRIKPDDNWKTADITLIKKKFPILAAYYMPGADKSELYPSISAVNSFRVILNSYFRLGLPILEDRYYVNLDMQHRYDFREVTGEVTQ